MRNTIRLAALAHTRVVQHTARAASLYALRVMTGNPYHDEKGKFTSGDEVPSSANPGEFDPQIVLDYSKQSRPKPGQLAKLRDAYVEIDQMLHDPEIGAQLWATLSAFTPDTLRSRIEAIQTGVPQHIFGGGPNAPVVAHHEVKVVGEVPHARAAAAKIIDDALQRILTLMTDPDIGEFVQAMVLKAVQAGGWETLKTAGGAGSGNFGHSGRPGEVGGSSSDASGQPAWQSKGGFQNTGIVWKQETDPKTGRPIPIKVNTVEEAVALIHEGKVVEVKDTLTAYTLVDKLASMAQEAKAAGKEAKDYDLCKISVAGSNMFCTESLRNVDVGGKHYGPEGISRLEMPQLGGKPVPGSEAATLPRSPWDPSEVDGSAHFIAHLQGIGMRTSREMVPAANLRASQVEMKGNTVGAMMRDKSFDPAKNPIFVSRDNYVVDGHHRWAAVVGRDAQDGHLGDSMMNIVRVNAPISEVLHIANAWSKSFGIQQVAGVAKK